VVSETRIMVLRTIRGIKTTAVSETPTVTADSEIKETLIRTIVVSEILKAAPGHNLPAADSGIAPAAKAAVQTDSRAAAAALDKTIINNKTNS